MIPEDIKKLETKLGIQLPEPYREFLLKPPFEEDSSSFEFLSLRDADVLIENNEILRETAEWYPFLQPRSDYLCIGSDCSESWFVLKLNEPGNPVLEVAFHGTEEGVTTYPSFAEFITAMRDRDAEAKLDDEKAASTKWPAILVGAIWILGCVIYVAYKVKSVK